MSLLANGGFILFVIIGVSIFALYLFLERLFYLLKEPSDTDVLMDDVNAAVNDRDLDEALAICSEHGGPVARVLEYALSRLPYGRAAVESAFEEATLEEEQILTRNLSTLAIIAQIAPLLGLLGTVTGMIIAFDEISKQGTGNPALLAKGIGQALVTTAAGLIVAIPVLMGHNYLSRRVDDVLTEIERRREELMGRVVQVIATKRKDPESGQVTPRPQTSKKNDKKSPNPFRTGVEYETFDPA